MFGELISFIDVLKSTAIDLRGRKLGAEREATISALLETYFNLKDAADEGELLLEDAQPNPVAVIGSLNPVEAKERLASWDYALRRQTVRLMRVSDTIFGQEFMSVIAPELEEKLHDVLGTKFNRATSLHGIGAALFFRGWTDGTNEEKARYVSIMAGEENDLLHMDKIRAEIVALREAMEGYRIVVNDLATADEIIRLSRSARKATQLDDAFRSQSTQ
ncbi:hypothetical protein [Arenimonas sp.]|uniref:hypothetical protein n=1 Tax=Arenimonas sp. TaxID=1872635 RepID=UPI0025C4E336|nr:hypothetical protein [Arenimonas sp.]MDZ4055802.1 hypothetical protein [Polynucleobacter sp.]